MVNLQAGAEFLGARSTTGRLNQLQPLLRLSLRHTARGAAAWRLVRARKSCKKLSRVVRRRCTEPAETSRACDCARANYCELLAGACIVRTAWPNGPGSRFSVVFAFISLPSCGPGGPMVWGFLSQLKLSVCLSVWPTALRLCLAWLWRGPMHMNFQHFQHFQHFQ